MFFFLLWPRPDAHSLTVGWGDFGKAGWCFFFCCGPAGSFLVSLTRPGGAAAKKKTPRGGVFFFAAAPHGRSLTHCGPGWCLPLAGVVFFFLLRPRPDRGGVLFFCCGPAQTLTHSLWAGAISARFGWCFFFCCGPARSFLVSPKRPGGAAAKKNTTGRCFFFCCGPARTLTHSLRAWVVPPPRRGGVLFFAAAPPGPGWCFFFAVAPPGRSLTHCGLGRFWQGPGGPPRRSLTHFGLGRFRQGRMVFFFCCGPAGSFLVSLKRPGGAAAKKKTPRGGDFFFAAAPRGRSLTHCGPGWCLPLAGVVFFFFAAAPPGRGGVFFFAVAPPRRSLTHCGLGRFRQGRMVFFFLLWPRRVFFG